MAQISSGAAGVDTRVREAFAGIFTPEERAQVRDAMVRDGGRIMAEILAQESETKPKIMYNDSGHLIPASMTETFAMARWFAGMKLYGTRGDSGIRYYTEPEIALIIAAGRRLKLDPLAAMETIALINNRTAIWGRGIRGIVMASGLVEDWHEAETDIINGICGESARIVVTVRRKGIPTPFVGSFSVEQAEQAGLWVEEADVRARPGLRHSAWWKYPADMLRWRAVGRAVLGFADVLAGMRVAEDIDAEPEATAEKPATVAQQLTSVLRSMSDQQPKEEPPFVPTPAPEPVPAPKKPDVEPVRPAPIAVSATPRRRRGSRLTAEQMIAGTGGNDLDEAMNAAQPNRDEGAGK